MHRPKVSAAFDQKRRRMQISIRFESIAEDDLHHVVIDAADRFATRAFESMPVRRKLVETENLPRILRSVPEGRGSGGAFVARFSLSIDSPATVAVEPLRVDPFATRIEVNAHLPEPVHLVDAVELELRFLDVDFVFEAENRRRLGYSPSRCSIPGEDVAPRHRRAAVRASGEREQYEDEADLQLTGLPGVREPPGVACRQETILSRSRTSATERRRSPA